MYLTVLFPFIISGLAAAKSYQQSQYQQPQYQQPQYQCSKHDYQVCQSIESFAPCSGQWINAVNGCVASDCQTSYSDNSVQKCYAPVKKPTGYGSNKNDNHGQKGPQAPPAWNKNTPGSYNVPNDKFNSYNDKKDNSWQKAAPAPAWNKKDTHGQKPSQGPPAWNKDIPGSYNDKKNNHGQKPSQGPPAWNKNIPGTYSNKPGNNDKSFKPIQNVPILKSKPTNAKKSSKFAPQQSGSDDSGEDTGSESDSDNENSGPEDTDSEDSGDDHPVKPTGPAKKRTTVAQKPKVTKKGTKFTPSGSDSEDSGNESSGSDSESDLSDSEGSGSDSEDDTPAYNPTKKGSKNTKFVPQGTKPQNKQNSKDFKPTKNQYNVWADQDKSHPRSTKKNDWSAPAPAPSRRSSNGDNWDSPKSSKKDSWSPAPTKQTKSTKPFNSGYLLQ